jgi:hypothetical protein
MTHQLIEWQPTKESAEKFLDTFRKYKQTNKVKLVHSDKGWALFTDGGLITGPEYRSERRSI